jgi:2-polyprenyl-3-methyl-5-hydroxy-6-metoxy-1,4-benzoquinol methylase
MQQPLEEIKKRWRDGRSSEVEFWDQWFETKGLEWPDEFRRRFDPTTLLEEPLPGLLPQVASGTLQILDVGAGPLTRLGYVLPGREVKITPVDALADYYDELLLKNGLIPPVRTQWCDGEALATRFAKDTFDLAVAINSLDHTYEPHQIISTMVDLVKPGCYVFLRHFRNEAVRENYVGMHQWNFDATPEGAIIWNPDVRFNLSESLREKADVQYSVVEGSIDIRARKREV